MFFIINKLFYFPISSMFINRVRPHGQEVFFRVALYPLPEHADLQRPAFYFPEALLLNVVKSLPNFGMKSKAIGPVTRSKVNKKVA